MTSLWSSAPDVRLPDSRSTASASSSGSSSVWMHQPFTGAPAMIDGRASAWSRAWSRSWSSELGQNSCANPIRWDSGLEILLPQTLSSAGTGSAVRVRGAGRPNRRLPQGPFRGAQSSCPTQRRAGKGRCGATRGCGRRRRAGRSMVSSPLRFCGSRQRLKRVLMISRHRSAERKRNLPF